MQPPPEISLAELSMAIIELQRSQSPELCRAVLKKYRRRWDRMLVGICLDGGDRRHVLKECFAFLWRHSLPHRMAGVMPPNPKPPIASAENTSVFLAVTAPDRWAARDVARQRAQLAREGREVTTSPGRAPVASSDEADP